MDFMPILYLEDLSKIGTSLFMSHFLYPCGHTFKQ